ncbi:TonB-dependent receptor [Rosenbergiella nectarea]|uniref:TonB-dependent receptor n=1 Tax=Rosenbergiella nectarea TaxID=988801 RepID=UPI001BD9A962|nr:TonB-dependent receptor [Rosenbergiella nectarea]MBT0731538.1 TonB-dependent receptor [Rosenbergiella nectarea subsp. apis]
MQTHSSSAHRTRGLARYWVLTALVPMFSYAATADTNSASTLEEAITQGKVSGSLRSMYYSTHNAYFAQGLNQDTISYGGFLKYETAPLDGFNLGVSGIFVRGINHGSASQTVSELGDNQTNIGEAWLQWRNDDFRITAGNQQLDIPFLGNYDWRITPMIYQAIDTEYGQGEDFIRATKVFRYKSWGSDRQQRYTAYGSDEKTNGMWSLGAGHHWDINDVHLNGVAWYENYNDYSDIFYTEGHAQWNQAPLQPDFGIQYLRGTGNGKDLAGPVNSQSIGWQLSLNLLSNLNWKVGYDYLANNASGHQYPLVTPYAHNASSGPYFAQPFFTSTQDLGNGNAWATSLNYSATEQVTVGTRYSWMDLKPANSNGSLRQSEYLVYGIYSFGGALKGLSLTDFVGVQTSPLYKKDFWQNRVALQYDF